MNDIKKRIYRSFMRIMYIGWVGASLCSCEKYLDIKPYGQTIPKTTEEFAAMVHELC